MESIVVLLTGTIKVSNVPDLLLTDTMVREAEYCDSIKKWTELGYPVIFCENSNYESEKINAIVKDIPESKFEYLKFKTRVSHFGKGRGEAEIIDHVFKHSRLIHEHTIICKATGKNFVSNAANIFQRLLNSAGGKSIVSAMLVKNLTMADSRFFFFKKNFYFKYWVNCIDEVNEKDFVYLEHTLAKAIHVAIAAGEKWSLPPARPVINGYLGTIARKYRNGYCEGLVKDFFYWVVKKGVAGTNG